MRMTDPSILVDTRARIEMITGSEKGDHVRSVIRDNPNLSVSVLTIFELRYCLEQLCDGERAVTIIRQIIGQVEIIPVTDQRAMLGGMIGRGQRQRKISMGAVDCMIPATARLYGLKILSGDKHFAGLDEMPDV